MTAHVSIRSVARSHIGEVRQTNEDRILNCAKYQLWAVADGMGGQSMGDVAAEIVVGALAELARSNPKLSKASIQDALERANSRVLDLVTRLKSRSGSTVAGLHLNGPLALVFWAGDSRVYRRRNGVVTLLTHDHRVVQELIDAGLIDTCQAKQHRQASVITRAVGATEAFVMASHAEEALAGDTYLLCSDGLSDLVDADEIDQSMSLEDYEAADRLINSALAAGGTDNISVVIVSIDNEVARSNGTQNQIDSRTCCN